MVVLHTIPLATQQREAFRSPPTSPYVCRRSRVIARVDLFQYLFVGVACDRRAVVRLGRFLLVVRLESGGVAPEDDNSVGGAPRCGLLPFCQCMDGPLATRASGAINLQDISWALEDRCSRSTFMASETPFRRVKVGVC